jgi:hypothetical protein
LYAAEQQSIANKQAEYTIIGNKSRGSSLCTARPIKMAEPTTPANDPFK